MSWKKQTNTQSKKFTTCTVSLTLVEVRYRDCWALAAQFNRSRKIRERNDDIGEQTRRQRDTKTSPEDFETRNELLGLRNSNDISADDFGALLVPLILMLSSSQAQWSCKSCGNGPVSGFPNRGMQECHRLTCLRSTCLSAHSVITWRDILTQHRIWPLGEDCKPCHHQSAARSSPQTPSNHRALQDIA